MISKPRGSVTLPRLPRGVGNLLKWSREVNQCLQQLRDRVVVTKSSKGVAASAPTSYIPWDPQFFTTGSLPSLVYKCRINLGTVNNVAASNWNAEHVLPSAEDEFKFVVLTITSANGKVSGVEISVDAASPATDAVSKDVPPGTQKILLGAIGRSSAKMIIVKNLQMAGVEVFRETKSSPAVGAEPFSRWWRWEYSTV